MTALQRKDGSLSDWLRRQIEDSFNDPRPNVPAREVFERLREHHAARLKTKGMKKFEVGFRPRAEERSGER
jgi:antitoxin ParD1/3/4